MKEKFSKNSAKKNLAIKKIILVICILLLILGVLLLVIGSKNIIEYSNEDDNAKYVSDDVAKNSNAILVNNVLVGAVYNDTWVSSERYYFLSQNKEGSKVEVYNNSGKKGTYKLENISKGANESTIYISTSNSNKNDEYVATLTRKQ